MCPRCSSPLKLSFILALSTLALFATHAICLAEGATSATLYSMQGSVEANQKQQGWHLLGIGEQISHGDELRVDATGRAALLFSDGVLLRLGSGAHFKFGDIGQNGEPVLKALTGQFHFFNRTEKTLPTIETPTVSASTRGTELAVEVKASETTISVIDGSVECSNNFGSVRAARGEKVSVSAGAAPTKALLLNPYDSVQWALYYPSVIGPTELGSAIQAGSPVEKKVAKILASAAEKLSRGDVSGSEKLLLTAKNSLLLEYSPSKDRIEASILAQQAIVALVQNRKNEASALAHSAWLTKEDSIPALLAKAYTEQANFDLDSARSYLEKALVIAPDNAIALSRLAELELSAGEIEEASVHISSALQNDPTNAFAQTLLGFESLFRNETQNAAKAFEKATSMDESFGLPRLGLGLTLIKQGEFQKGRSEIEKAILLEPTTSVYRSYLGKAFFEEEKENLAAREYQLALDLDGQDPTPYLYRAFNKLSKNQVVDALMDLEKSVELNENRAVYRSSLQLDQDLGMRSAGLARVYNDLGFSRLAQLEAVKSINRDYQNYSAHRFLADTQETLFTPDAAFSERRIALLLAPLSFNLFSSSGSEATLNDYDALFDKSEDRTNANFIYQNTDDLYAGEVFQAGKTDKLGYFVGVSGAFGEGSYHNNVTRDYRTHLALQYQPSYQDRILLDGQARFRETSQFNEASQTDEREPYALTLGYNRKLNAHSSLIAATTVAREQNRYRDYTNRELDIEEISSDVPSIFSDMAIVSEGPKEDLNSVHSEVQYLWNSRYLSVVSGLEHLYASPFRREGSSIIDDEQGILSDLGYPLNSDSKSYLNSEAAYLYNRIHLSPLADLDLGLNYAVVEREYREVPPFVSATKTKTQLSPKLGLTLYPTSKLTLRTAYFETLQKSMLEDQASLEPTFVGGLNQRLRQLSGASARNLGTGLDLKASKTTFVGGDWIHRHLVEPLVDAKSGYSFDYDNLALQQTLGVSDFYDNHVDQDLVHAYVYQILSSKWVSSFDYTYAQNENTDPLSYGRSELNKLALALKYFDRTGLYAYGQAAWREQDSVAGVYEDGVSDFWTFDAGIGYRIPKRHGTIALQFLNLTNEHFKYDQIYGIEPQIADNFTVRLVTSYNF